MTDIGVKRVTEDEPTQGIYNVSLNVSDIGLRKQKNHRFKD